jgi:hypothetical protein
MMSPTNSDNYDEMGPNDPLLNLLQEATQPPVSSNRMGDPEYVQALIQRAKSRVLDNSSTPRLVLSRVTTGCMSRSRRVTGISTTPVAMALGRDDALSQSPERLVKLGEAGATGITLSADEAKAFYTTPEVDRILLELVLTPGANDCLSTQLRVLPGPDRPMLIRMRFLNDVEQEFSILANATGSLLQAVSETVPNVPNTAFPAEISEWVFTVSLFQPNETADVPN